MDMNVIDFEGFMKCIVFEICIFEKCMYLYFILLVEI